MRFGSLGLAIGSVDIGSHRRITAAPWPIVAGIGPDLTGLRSPSTGIEDRRGGLVGEQPLGSSQSLKDVIANGPKIPCCPADPVCKGGTIQLDALPGIDLRLPVKRQVIGILGHQHLRDQRFGGDTAFDDPCGRRSLHDRALARAAAIARTAGDQHAEGGGDNIEAFGDILADLVERAAAAGTSLLLDIHDLLDPLKMGGQRSAVGLARALALGLGHRGISCGVHDAKRRLDILQGELELIGVELLGLAAEPVPLEGLEDRLQALDPGIGLALGIGEIGQCAGLFEDERTQRVNVIGKVRFHQHMQVESVCAHPVKRQSAVRSDGVRRARGASPDLPAKRPVGQRSAASRPPESGAT